MLDVLEWLLQHAQPGLIFRKRNVYPALEPSSDCEVEGLWEVGCPEDEDPVCLVAYSLHLGQKLCLHPLGGLVVVVRSTAAESVYLVDEDDRRLLLAGQGEQRTYHLFSLADIFA